MVAFTFPLVMAMVKAFNVDYIVISENYSIMVVIIMAYSKNWINCLIISKQVVKIVIASFGYYHLLFMMDFLQIMVAVTITKMDFIIITIVNSFYSYQMNFVTEVVVISFKVMPHL